MNQRTRRGFLAIAVLLLLGGLAPLALKSRRARTPDAPSPWPVTASPLEQAVSSPVSMPGKPSTSSDRNGLRKADPAAQDRARGVAKRISPPIAAAPSGKAGEYVLRDRNVSAFFTGKGIALAMARPSAALSRLGVPVKAEAPLPTPGWGLHWGMEGAREVAPRPEGELPGKVNYFVGDKSKWRAEQPTYSKMVYSGVQPGVDMIVEARPHGLEYRLDVAAGAKLDALRFRYEGAKEVRVVDNGSALEIVTGLGVLKEGELKCWQEGPGGKKEVAARYVSRGGAEYGIALGPRDPKLPLVIDPTVSWSSFLGGGIDGVDELASMAQDGAGNIYLTGRTSTLSFPTNGGYDTTYGGGPYDVFVTKVSSAGALFWSTYLGGGGHDEGVDIAVDASQNVYVTGETRSSDFPILGGFDSLFQGTLEGFITKVDAGGASLVWSTYLGGTGDELGRGIAVDASGNVYVAGQTYSSDFPVVGGFDPSFGGGLEAFVTKVSSDGSGIVWSSFLGGSGQDWGMDIAVDGSGNAYVSGQTDSSDFPVTNGFDMAYGGGIDGFVTKVNADGASLAWSSFMGGSAQDTGERIAVDGSGNAYVAGSTYSSDFAMAGGFDTTFNGGTRDVFVAKVNSGGASLAWSTYLGGTGDDSGTAVAVDGSGNVYVTGSTQSGDFPIVGGFDGSNAGGGDAFVVMLNPSGSGITWSSYLGGAGYESGAGLGVDGTGNVYVAGITTSYDFPTLSAFDNTYGGQMDTFITKVDASGSGILWSSYLGGNKDDWAMGVAVDNMGNVYVTGKTCSTTFPTIGSFDASFGGIEDAFIVKIDTSGTSIVWSSYLGGNYGDGGNDVTVDSSGYVYVVGYTSSSDFPIVAGFDPVYKNGDAFIAKIVPSGSSIVWSSYLGGTSGWDIAEDVAVDNVGNVYVTGLTMSPSFPSTGGFDSSLGGVQDAFIAKVNADGTSLAWASYLGGSGSEYGFNLVVDQDGNVYVTGDTYSVDFPTTGGIDSTLGGTKDAFVTKVGSDGSAIVWSTYLGGSGEDRGNVIAIDSSGDVYVCGFTGSSDFPAINGFNNTFGGSWDAFVTRINSAGSSIVWSSYLGGGSSEEANGIALDSMGNVYVTGQTGSVDFPIIRAVDSTYAGGYDAFITKINGSGTTVAWSSYLGGTADDYGYGVAVDGSGSVYVTGATNSSDFAMSGGFDITYGGRSDCFIAKILSDSSPPLIGTVSDGSGADVDFQVSTTTITANWSGFSDPQSGIAGYEWAIGTTPGGTDVQGWTSVGLATSATNSSLSLTVGQTYYVTVRATNGDGLTATASSDRITINNPTWSGTGALLSTRVGQQLVLLPNGKVLALGGNSDGSHSPKADCELFDPSLGTWSATGSLSSPRSGVAATVLPNGLILASGGGNSTTIVNTCQLYDPSTGTWSPAGSMANARGGHTATLLSNGKVLVAGGIADLAATTMVTPCELYDPATDSWSPAGSLTTGRYMHAATLLPDGDVLVSGGGIVGGGVTAACERYDSVAGTWSTTGALNQARCLHTMTLLPSGLALAASGQNPGSTIVACELYDPGSGTWSLTGSVATGRLYHSASLLPNGQVLIAGGDTTVGSTGGGTTSCELYDPANGTWSSTASMAAARYSHGSVILPGGQVLVAGGSPEGTSGLSSCEIYSPAMGSWVATGSLPEARGQHQSVVLPDGRVLVAGGTGSSGTPVNTVRLYDPSTGNWSNAASMAESRYGHMLISLLSGKVLVLGGTNAVGTDLTACEIYDPSANRWTYASPMFTSRRWSEGVRLKDGHVLVAGSGYGFAVTGLCDIYEPLAGSWSATSSLNTGRNNYTLTLLQDGRVLAVGGAASGASSLSSCEIFDPSGGAWTTTNPLPNEARREHTATLLPDGRVLVAGGFQEPPNVRLATCAIYNPSTGTWAVTGSMNAARMQHSAVLLPSGKVLVSGGDNSGALKSCEVYDPATGLWTVTASLAGGHQLHTANLLPDGRVLAAGGLNGTATALCEIYEDTGADAAWRPTIATINGSSSSPFPVAPGSTLTLAGVRFRGISQASGGRPAASSADYPIVRLVSLSGSSGQSGGCGRGNGRSWTLPSTGWVDGTSLTVPLPPAGETPEDYYLLSVIVNGIPGEGRILRIGDSTGPTMGTVNDGTGSDISVQVSTTAISANWSGFRDPESGIASYQWAIGTTWGGQEIQALTDVGLATRATNASLSLAVGTTYYVTVRAINGVGLITWNISNGATISAVTADKVVVLSGTTVSCVRLSDSSTVWSTTLGGAERVYTLANQVEGWNVLVSRTVASVPVTTCLQGTAGNEIWTMNGALGPQSDIYTDARKVFYSNPVAVPYGAPNRHGSDSPDIILVQRGTPSTVRVVDSATGAWGFQVSVDFEVNEVNWLPVGGAFGQPVDYDLICCSTTGQMCRIRGDTGVEVWRRNDLANRYGVGILDVNGDGIGDFAAARKVWSDDMLMLSGADGSTIWTVNYGSMDLVTGTPELVEGSSGGTDFIAGAQGASSGAVRRYRCTNGTPVWSCNSTYSDNTIYGVIWRTNGGTVVSGWRHQDRACGFDLASGTALWDNVPNYNADIGLIGLPDVTGDGSDDVLSLSTDGNARLYDGVSGTAVGGFVPIPAADLAYLPHSGTPPVAGTVNDGAAADIDMQGSTTTITANWSGFTDPESGIAQYEWAIGTTAGGIDIQDWTDVALATSATNSGLTLSAGATYYVSVRATNLYNMQTLVSSNGVTVDTNGPTAGTVNDGAGADADFQVSTTTIAANWSGFGDPESGIAGYDWAIGTTSGGTDVQGWTGVGLATSATNSSLSLASGTTYFVTVRATNGAGLQSTAVTADGVLADGTAPIRGWIQFGNMSIGRIGHTVTPLDDGRILVAGGGSTTDNSSTTNSVEIFDPATSTFTLVAPMISVRGSHEAVKLQDGRVLVIGGHDASGAMMAQCEMYDPVSDSWTATGSLNNASANHRVALLANGRVVVYGENGSGFGSTACELYNPGTGTWSLTGSMSVARHSPGGCLMANGNVLAAGGYAFNSGVEVYDSAAATWSVVGSLQHSVSDCYAAQLPDGKVFITGGHYWSGVHYVYPDVSVYTPATGLVTVGPPMLTGRAEHGMILTQAGDLVAIGGLWADGMGSAGALNPCERYDVSSGSWKPFPALNTARRLGPYSRAVKVGGVIYVFGGLDNANGVLSSCEYIPVDPPQTTGIVNDGPGADIDVQTSTSTISANWTGFSDPESGITGYEWAIGTTPGGTNVQGWTSVGMATSATNSSLSLASGTTYYVTVRATNGAGLQTTATSDGVAVDATAPVAGAVNDGAGADIAFQGSTTTISANWSGFSDPEEGISGYEWAIGTTSGGTNVQGWTGVGLSTSATNSSLTLTSGVTYYATVRATNGSGLTSTASSNGVTVDTTAPPAAAINDGTGGDSDSQTSLTTISGNWAAFVDPESGIALYEWAIGTSPGATDVQGWTGAGTATSATNSGLALTVGSTYYVSVRATNGVGMQNTSYTNGVTITTTNNPPLAIPGASLQQFQSGGVTPIGVGGTATSPNVVLRAACSDPDAGDPVRLQVEVRKVNEPLTGTITNESPLGANGSILSVDIGPLEIGANYHWQARVLDGQNALGPWTAFGGNDDLVYPAEPDFAIGNPPNNAPSAAGQAQRTTGRAALPVCGGLTPLDTGFNVEATVSDPDAGQEVRLEVEIKPVDTPFADVATHSAGPAASGTLIQVPVTGLQNGGNHWQCRAVDSFGLPGPWTSFGGNAETAADVVAGAGPSFTMPEGPKAPALVLFDSPEYPGDTFYEWDFDYDGTTFTADYTGPSTGDCSYRYTEARNQPYRARLGVTVAGVAQYFDLYVTVEAPPAPPTVTVSATTIQGQVPLTIDFTASVTGFGVINSIEWDFNGDGSVDYVTINDQFTATYTYLLPGQYTCRVKATDSAGAADVDEMTIVALPAPDAPTVIGLTPLPPVVNPGDTVEFVCTADPGSSGQILRFEWDFDGNGDVDFTHVVSPPGAGPVTSTVAHVYDKTGLYPCRVVVVDSDNLAAVASTEVTVNAPPTLSVWWSQPKDGESVRGNAVTLLVNTAPGNLTAKVEFYYRPSAGVGSPQPPMTNSSWIKIGESVPPPFSFFSVAWDTTGLAAGPYDLLAVATDTSGTRVSSQAKGNVTVVVTPAAVPQDEANHVTTVESNSDASAVVAGRIDLEIENGGVVDAAGQVPASTTVTIAPPPDDVALNHATAQDLTLPRRYYTRITLEGSQKLQKPGRLTMYYRDDNNDGIEDYSKVPAEKLKGFRFDKDNDRWEPLLDVTVDKAEKRVYMRTPAFSDFALGGPTYAAAPGEGGSSKCFGGVAAEPPSPWGPLAPLGAALVLLGAIRFGRANRG